MYTYSYYKQLLCNSLCKTLCNILHIRDINNKQAIYQSQTTLYAIYLCVLNVNKIHIFI